MGQPLPAECPIREDPYPGGVRMRHGRVQCAARRLSLPGRPCSSFCGALDGESEHRHFQGEQEAAECQWQEFTISLDERFAPDSLDRVADRHDRTKNTERSGGGQSVPTAEQCEQCGERLNRERERWS